MLPLSSSLALLKVEVDAAVEVEAVAAAPERVLGVLKQDVVVVEIQDIQQYLILVSILGGDQPTISVAEEGSR